MSDWQAEALRRWPKSVSHGVEIDQERCRRAFLAGVGLGAAAGAAHKEAEHDSRVTELLEANNREVERRREVGVERDQWNRVARRLSGGLIAIHEAGPDATVAALKSVAYDIALNCIDHETARFQIERRSSDVV